jgi:hypothetical protein
MRTVWLALFCLIGLATTVVVKFGMLPYAGADVSQSGAKSSLEDVSRKAAPAGDAASSPDGTIATNIQDDTSTKADRLDASNTGEAFSEIKSVKSVLIAPIETEPKSKTPEKMERIVSRHWHDPLDYRSVPVAVRPSAKRKSASTGGPRIASERAPKP